MSSQHFFFKLIPPRPTFAFDMTEPERGLMMQHLIYMRGFFEAGAVLAYGPVLDPAGSFGIALLDMTDLEAAQRFAEGDPTIVAGMMRYSVVPMKIGGARGFATKGE